MSTTTATTVRLIDQAGEHRPLLCRPDAISAALLLHWFPDAPSEVAQAISDLQAAVVASQRTSTVTPYGEYEAFLGVKVEPVTDDDEADEAWSEQPVDSTYHPCCNAIGRHARDCGPTTDVGAAPQPPHWAEPGSTPDWFTPTGGDTQICIWERQLGAVGPWISCEDRIIDGRVLRSEPRIFGAEEPSDGLTANAARELAAQLVAIADILDAQAVRQ